MTTATGAPSGRRRAAAPDTWRQIFEVGRRRLGSPSDARRIVEEAGGLDRHRWTGDLDTSPPPRAAARCLDMIERRAAGEPLQYVLGSWGFRTVDLLVDKRVLIPRPETELVVERAVEVLDELRAVGRPPWVAVDLGTGSGAIALSLAAESRVTAVWATERSAEALAVARANLAGLGGRAGTRVRFAEGSWFDPLPVALRGQVSLVVSNPPYVSEQEFAALDDEVRLFEPKEALVPGPTGTEAIAQVLSEAPRWLRRPGAAVLEVPPHSAQEAAALAEESGFDTVEVEPDLAGRPRALVARLVARL